MRAPTHISLVLTAALLLALASGPHVGGAASQTTDDAAKPKNPLAGDGMWIWYVSRSRGKPGKIAKKARRYGIETVLIKSADGGKYWKQFSASLVSALKARGLNVCAWQFVYGRGAAKERAAGRRR